MEFNYKIEDLLAQNIVDMLSDDELDYIGREVCEETDEDLTSRAEWEQRVDEWINLTMQVAEEKTYPWPGAANIKYPLITTGALQFSSRAYGFLLSNYNIARGRVIGFDQDGAKAQRAIRLGKHMSYQLLEQMDDWEEGMDRLLFSLAIVGCMFKKTYFDPVKSKNISEVIYPKELVVNYWATSLEDAARITHILYMTENDIYERVSDGIFRDVDLIEKASESLRDTQDNVMGLQDHSDEKSKPYCIYEQHCFFDLDGDGYAEPYIVTVDSKSKQVLRIVARYKDSTIKLTADGDILRITPLQFFTKYSFIPSPDGGFYDIGFGLLLSPINESINTLLNMLHDSGAINNMQAGFLARGIRIKGGNQSFNLGEWKTVNSTGDDIRKGIVPLPTREPSSVLFQLLGLMIDTGQQLSSVTEIMQGEIPGQNTKATVAMAAIEQGMKIFSSIYKRIYRSLGKEFKKIYMLNSEYLPDQEYFMVLDPGAERAETIKRIDYNLLDADVVPSADPNIVTEQQRLAKIKGLFELLALGTLNVQEVTRRYLEATEQPDIESLMNVPKKTDPELEMEKMRLKLEILDRELKAREIQGKNILNVAQAEGVEAGNQLAYYKEQVNELQVRLQAQMQQRAGGKPSGGNDRGNQ